VKIPQFLGVFFGAISFIIMTLIVGSMGLIPPAPHPLGGVLLFLCVIAGLVVLNGCIVLVAAVISSPVDQYCPDCLSYMTRGAKVCPFCGFRETPPPGAHQQTSAYHRRRA
jgi:hypothetical protein